MSTYSLLNAGRIVAGPDSIEQIAEIVKDYGASRVLIISDKGVARAGLIEAGEFCGVLLERPGQLAGEATILAGRVVVERDEGELVGLFVEQRQESLGLMEVWFQHMSAESRWRVLEHDMDIPSIVGPVG